MSESETPIIGLRVPWKWVQPQRHEIKQRLLEARDFRVAERERENMCSVAHGEIVTLERETSRLREERDKALAAVKDLNDAGTGQLYRRAKKEHATIIALARKEER